MLTYADVGATLTGVQAPPQDLRQAEERREERRRKKRIRGQQRIVGQNVHYALL